MAITTTSLMPSPIQLSFNMKLLAVPVPDFIHSLAAMRQKMPMHSGNKMRMRRYNPLATALVPLGNSGIMPPAQTLSALDIDAQISFYGTYVAINEQVSIQNTDPVLNEAVKRLGVSLRQTEDQLIRDVLVATASVVDAVGGINGDSPTEIMRSDVDGIVRALKGANAKSILNNIEAQDKFGTAPIRDSFLALGSTDLIGSIDAVQGFTHTAQYPKQDTLSAEWGAIGNLRFLLSSVGSSIPNASANGATVYNIPCVGMEAYTIIEQDGYSAEFIYRPAIYDSALALNSTAGYKFASAQTVTNDLWVLNLRCTI